MHDRPTKVFGMMCLLVVVWIATYWLYRPGEPPVTFDRPLAGPARADAATPGNSRRGVQPGPGPVRPDPLAQVEPRPPEPQPAGEAPGAKTRTGLDKPLPEPSERVEPPKFREYTVQQGDTGWMAIAQRVYGDSSYWEVVSRANPLVTPNKLIPGRTRLRIPIDPGNIQGKIVKTDPKPASAEPPASKKPSAEPAEAAKAAPIEYTIRAEDTLSSISKAFYGKAGLWRAIAAANTDRIPDPDRLPVGVKIIIPPK
jgi:nucleoid-associated protein YgaU